ncbi:HAD domain-containing protein [Micromonospora costi]|uniref:HAD domain-containing protein n=1 Tax=Micromonospora costi TaxID=1530042 RepID=UPI0033CBB571
MGSGLGHRPLVFLDVDGPLITFAARPTSPERPAPLDSPEGGGNPLLDRLRPEDGRMLLGLGCQLVWATTWMADANTVISPRLGLPRLPVVDWPDSDDEPPRGLHWKTRFLAQWAAGRPFVWLDDEITDADRAWIAAHHPERALLHRVDPYAGLTAADFSLIHRWLAE